MNKKAQIISKKGFWVMVIAIIAVALIFGEGKIPNKIILAIIGLVIVSPTFSFFIHSWIDSLGFDWLKEISVPCEIMGKEFSITAYAVLSEILLFMIF